VTRLLYKKPDLAAVFAPDLPPTHPKEHFGTALNTSEYDDTTWLILLDK